MLPLLLCHWCLPLPPSQLAGATGVVSCVGAFGSNEQMEKICGDATVTATEAAKKVLNELTNCAAYCVNTSIHLIRDSGASKSSHWSN